MPPPHRRRSLLFEIHVAGQLVNELVGRGVLFADNRTGALYRVAD